ncbi:hypothetical protein FKM82_000287 [Ascaphus truei]
MFLPSFPLPHNMLHCEIIHNVYFVGWVRIDLYEQRHSYLVQVIIEMLLSPMSMEGKKELLNLMVQIHKSDQKKKNIV